MEVEVEVTTRSLLDSRQMAEQQMVVRLIDRPDKPEIDRDFHLRDILELAQVGRGWQSGHALFELRFSAFLEPFSGRTKSRTNTRSLNRRHSDPKQVQFANWINMETKPRLLGSADKHLLALEAA